MPPNSTSPSVELDAPPARGRARRWLAGFAVGVVGLGVAGLVDAQLTTETSAAESFEQVMVPAPTGEPAVADSTSTTTAGSDSLLPRPVPSELRADVLLRRSSAPSTTGSTATSSPKASTTTAPGSAKNSPSSVAITDEAPTAAAPTTVTPVTAAPTTAAPTTVAPTTTSAAPEPITIPVPPESTTITTAAPAGNSTLSAADLEQLRVCESGGNYQSVNPRGPYSGAYQFSQGTWDWVAGAVGRSDLVGVSPAAASVADQDAMAVGLWSLAGPGQWPSCGGHLPPQP